MKFLGLQSGQSRPRPRKEHIKWPKIIESHKSTDISKRKNLILERPRISRKLRSGALEREAFKIKVVDFQSESYDLSINNLGVTKVRT